MGHPLNARPIPSGWNYLDKPLLWGLRQLYDEPDPNPPYSPEVESVEGRQVLFWPDVENALFLIDPTEYGHPMIWFPAFGHDTSYTFEEFPREPTDFPEEMMLAVATGASAGIDDRDSRLAGVLERLRPSSAAST